MTVEGLIQVTCCCAKWLAEYEPIYKDQVFTDVLIVASEVLSE